MLMRRDILTLHAQWILTIRNIVRLSRSFRDARADTAEDITQIQAVARVVISAPVFFAQTAAVSAVAVTLSPAAKRESYEDR